MRLERGLIQVYTGEGKGKTTAALGLGIRACGNGLRVKMIQFLKSGKSGELEVINSLGENFEIYRFEKEKDFTWNLSEEQKKEQKKEILEGFSFAKDIIMGKKCDLLILDEIMAAINLGYLDEDEVIQILDDKDERMEIVLTGRNVPSKIADKSNLITEMKPIKHYFNEGVHARKGIEY